MARNKFCLIFALSLFLPFSCFAQSGGYGGGGPGVGDAGGYGQVEPENPSAPAVKIDNNLNWISARCFRRLGEIWRKIFHFLKG